ERLFEGLEACGIEPEGLGRSLQALALLGGDDAVLEGLAEQLLVGRLVAVETQATVVGSVLERCVALEIAHPLLPGRCLPAPAGAERLWQPREARTRAWSLAVESPTVTRAWPAFPLRHRAARRAPIPASAIEAASTSSARRGGASMTGIAAS